ncbi:MAG: radical SAM protein [Deltaproteobacteria bacterium]|nr:radical SAM protein [Candidatus Anaeroferrophillacea bacterium]
MVICKEPAGRLPASVILEVTARCNLACLGCALHGPQRCVDRPTGDMTREVWAPVIAELGAAGHPVALTTHGGGEPLLHPELRDILRHARSFANLEVGFLTNGMLLDASWSEFLVDLGLPWIAVSIDGVDPENHRRLRRGSDLVRIEDNLETLLEIRRRRGDGLPAVRLNMVAYDEIADQRDAYLARWLDRVDVVMVSHYRNPPTSKRWPGVTGHDRKPCGLPWWQAVVAWDGRLALCCEDFNVDHPVGTVGAGGATLADCWNGPELTRVRALHRAGRWDEPPLCRECDTWAEEYLAVTADDAEIGCRVTRSPAQTAYVRLARPAAMECG